MTKQGKQRKLNLDYLEKISTFLSSNKKFGYLLAFFLSAVTASLFIIPHWIKSGVFYIGSDYVHQQVPFLVHLNRAIKEGNIFWDDTLDLGTQTIGGYSFYTLGSPFFWVSLLFPPNIIPSIMPILLILKIGLAGLTSYAWIRKQVKTIPYAIIGSLLYSFSGFQISNLNFNHFADVVALFPLLLLSLDKSILENKKFGLVFAIAINAFCNWFCFIGEVVFLVIYFFVKLWTGCYPKLSFKLFVRLAATSILGVMLSAVILVPSLAYIFGNPRAITGFTSISQMLLIKPIQIADLIRGMLMPPECGFYRGFFLRALFNGGELYLPLVGLVPAAAWILSNRKSFEARILLLCSVFMLIPILNSAFVAFNAEYYTRWFYMPSLVIALSSVKALEDSRISLKKGYAFYLFLWFAFFLVFLWFRLYFDVAFVYNWVIVIAFSIISIGGFVITLAIRKIQNKPFGVTLFTIGIMCFAVVCGFYNIYLMNKCWDSEQIPKDYYSVSDTIKLDDEQTYYRIDSDGYYFYNIGVMAERPSMDSFSSTIEPSIFDFYSLVEEPRSVISDLPEDKYGYRAFLSTKYWLRYRKDSSDLSDLGWKYYGTQGVFTILENEWYIPLGYCYDSYITEEAFKSLPKDMQHMVLVKALVLDNETAKRYKDILKEVEDIKSFTKEDFISEVNLRRESGAYSSKKTNRGYTIEIDIKEGNLVFLSIPWDKGWTVTVNGKATIIEKVTGGFIAVWCEEGNNTILLKYTPVGLRLGSIISISAIIISVSWFIFSRKHKEKYVKD